MTDKKKTTTTKQTELSDKDVDAVQGGGTVAGDYTKSADKPVSRPDGKKRYLDFEDDDY